MKYAKCSALLFHFFRFRSEPMDSCGPVGNRIYLPGPTGWHQWPASDL